MSLSVCSHCTTKFAVGIPHCPQCGNADYYEEGSMAKITRHGGPTHVGDIAAPEPVTDTVDGAAEEAVVEEAESVSAYDGWLREDLKAELERRGLPTSGNKPELVARLVAADDAEDAEEETVEPEAAPEE